MLKSASTVFTCNSFASFNLVFTSNFVRRLFRKILDNLGHFQKLTKVCEKIRTPPKQRKSLKIETLNFLGHGAFLRLKKTCKNSCLEATLAQALIQCYLLAPVVLLVLGVHHLRQVANHVVLLVPLCQSADIPVDLRL